MADRHFYLRQVYPKLAIPLAEWYPQVSLEPRVGHRSLGEHPLVMLVAFTGTGKTTTLNLLRQEAIIPSRRQTADWIAIPMAQTICGQPLRLVKDRVQRFHYTRIFAERVSGGMARAFSWLQLAHQDQSPILSEGIRGENEIRYALRHFPRWQIIELTLHPVTRLQRLSARQHDFDLARGAADLSFLSVELQAQAQALLKAGHISSKAVSIVRAEAANYGLHPFGGGEGYSNYHRIEVDGSSPQQVADAVRAIIAMTKEAADAKN